METNKIYQKDCIEGLKELDENSIDCIWTDRPYNINYKYDQYKDKMIDYFEWCNQWLSECYRVLKPNGSIFVKMWSRYILDYKVVTYVGTTHRLSDSLEEIWNRAKKEQKEKDIDEVEKIIQIYKDDLEGQYKSEVITIFDRALILNWLIDIELEIKNLNKLEEKKDD